MHLNSVRTNQANKTNTLRLESKLTERFTSDTIDHKVHQDKFESQRVSINQNLRQKINNETLEFSSTLFDQNQWTCDSMITGVQSPNESYWTRSQIQANDNPCKPHNMVTDKYSSN